jgi:Protein of unknown function (DUF1573)
MKSILIALAIVVAGNTTFAQEKAVQATTVKGEKAPKKQKPNVTFAQTTIEKLNIVNGADESFVFQFKNTGKVPVMITNVATSCGCTTAKKPEEPIAPGKKSEIVVKYDTKRVGEFTKTITITTSVGEPIVLTIKGSVQPAASVPQQDVKTN